MKTIATLPPLDRGQVWCYHPVWVYWERIESTELDHLNFDRVTRGMTPYRSGTPFAGAEVRWDDEVAIYLPGVTT
jgi:hypothetical protein